MTAPTLSRLFPHAPGTAVNVDILNAVAQMAPISLAEMESVRLLDRVDTKFLLTEQQLTQILQTVGHQYRVLAATDDRINRYRTIYFDTPDFTTYQQHHNDFHPRYKIRCREYMDSNMFFMEIKCKTNRRRTVKRRMEINTMVERLDHRQFHGRVIDFIGAYSPLEPRELTACIQNQFGRITLVSRARPERLTIDVDYSHSWHGRRGGLPGIVIAEVKQPKFSVNSDFVQQLRRQGIRRTGFSKYCTGIIDLYPYVKYNRFKRRFLMLDRLNRQSIGRPEPVLGTIR